MTVVEDFAADYFVSQGLTEHRRKAVLRTLRALEEFGQAPPEMLDELVLRNFITARVASGRHVNSVRFDLNAVKPFYRWCWERRIIDADRLMRIKTVKPPRGSTDRGRPRPYRRREIQRFWTELDARFPLKRPQGLKRWRNGHSAYKNVWRHAMNLQIHAVTSMALFGGLRATEIRLADLDDIHPDNDFIVVRGKSPFGVRQGLREVPYTEQGREFVGRWLDFRDELAPKHGHPWLVVTAYASPNKALGCSTPLDRISAHGFVRLLSSVGPGWELHRFRHTCATEWLRAGAELEQVSKLLGHATIQQTLGYAELVREDLARGMRRVEQDFVTAVGRRHKQLVR